MTEMLARIAVLILVAAACGVQSAARAADDAPLEVAWTGRADSEPHILETGNGSQNGPDEVRLVSQAALGGDDASRFYVSKVLGTTFANIRISTAAPAHGPHAAWASPSSANASLFTAALVGGVRTPWESTLRYNSLIDLDMSYRFLSFAAASSTLTQPGLGGIGSMSSSMTAGELFFMLRVYEPFQWAKHLRSRDFYLPQ
jgi:hypothetical protein